MQKTADEILNETLKSMGYPVARMKYSGEAETFLIFMIVNISGVDHADDENNAYEITYGIDIYSRKDYTAILRRVLKLLNEAGFYGADAGPELYESDTGYYHMPLEIKYLEV